MTANANQLGQLRRLARENQQMGPRLARHEFRAFCQELESDALFDLSIDFDFETGPDLVPSTALMNDPVARHLPSLNVPLGQIAWVPEPLRLPVLGIYLGDAEPQRLRTPFHDLMYAHHAQPFARFVFLCQRYRIAPLLGRYGFAFQHVGDQPCEVFAPRIARRFGAIQIRDLISGKLLWSPPGDSVPPGTPRRQSQ